MNRHLTGQKWIALILLATGVAAVTVGGQKQTEAKASNIIAPTQANRMLGMAIILGAACCSSLAGVYFEKILKGSQVTLWARNLQLAGFSLIIGGVTIMMSSDDSVRQKGLLHGYTKLTWICVAMNAFGGLLVGTVIKYADAIMKDIALGGSIVVSALGSVVFFSYVLTPTVGAGIGAVIYAALLYNGRAPGCPPPEPPKTDSKPTETVQTEKTDDAPASTPQQTSAKAPQDGVEQRR